MTLVGQRHGRGAEEIIAEAQAYLGPYRAAQRHAEIDAWPTVLCMRKRSSPTTAAVAPVRAAAAVARRDRHPRRPGQPGA